MKRTAHGLPTHDEACAAMAAAERDAGWLAACEARDQYLAVTVELIEALRRVLEPLDAPIIEVAAGHGALSAALRDHGVPIEPTDIDPPNPDFVARRTARAALERMRPRTVLGCFVPFDAGIDQAVLTCPDVRHYLVLNARIGGALGSAALWHTPGWSATRLSEIERWMLTRHDVWMGEDQPPLRHGEAWLLRRAPAADAPDASTGAESMETER